MVSSLVLDNETLIALNALQDSGLLDGPVADVRPLLIVGLDVLLCVRGLPSALPVVCELLKERSLECGGLQCLLVSRLIKAWRITYCEGRLRNGGGRGNLGGRLLGAHNGGSERCGSSN